MSYDDPVFSKYFIEITLLQMNHGQNARGEMLSLNMTSQKLHLIL